MDLWKHSDAVHALQSEGKLAQFAKVQLYNITDNAVFDFTTANQNPVN